MTRDDWCAYIESVPLTGGQLGRIMGEWERLGLAGDEDRTERLALTAAIAGLDELESTHELTQGQGGRVVWRLQRCDDLGELRDEYGLDDGQASRDLDDVAAIDEPGVTLGQALTLTVAWLAFPEHRAAIERGWQQIASRP